MNFLARVAVLVRIVGCLSEHVVSDADELLHIQRQATLLRFCQVMERTEQFLPATCHLMLATRTQVPIHQLEEHFAFIFQKDLVAGKLADGEEVCNQALIKSDLLVEGEVYCECIEDSIHVAKLFTLRNLRYVHHIAEAEECVNVDARL